MSALIKRNLLLYFRDKASVFFSLLAVLIIIGLYLLFLGDSWVKSMEDIKNAKVIMDSWIMAGLLAVVSLTTTMGAFGIMVDDRHNGISKDFYSSPVSRLSVTGGYIFSACLVGIIMSVITFIFAQVYIVAKGGAMLGLPAILQVLGLIALTCLANTAIVGFVVSSLKSQNAFSTASTIIGTLMGFIAGIYMPMGIMPESIQYVIKAVPVAHAGALFRQIMLKVPLDEGFALAPAEAREAFCKTMGIKLFAGETFIKPAYSIVYLALTAILFFGLTVLVYRRKKKSF